MEKVLLGCRYRVLFYLIFPSVIYFLPTMMSILLVALIIIPYVKQLTTQMMLSIILQISAENVFWT